MATPPFSSVMPQCTPAPIPDFPEPVPVIGPQFCLPHIIELKIKELIGKGNYVVQDINGNQIFKVKGAFLTLHDHRVLCDTAGNPIVTLRQKRPSLHNRWNVFNGKSQESKDQRFTVKKSSFVQMKTELHVFLKNNTSDEKVCDYKIEGCWMERSCVIYAKDTPIAQMRMENTFKSCVFGMDDLLVTVYSNIDYAFIVTLILIFAEVSVEIIPGAVAFVKNCSRALNFATFGN